MDKLKHFINKFSIIDLLIIALLVIGMCFLYSNHLSIIFLDKGREFLIPQEILNGKVPYKDIMLIYFPTAYYINALIYKILGISINSLTVSQAILSIFYMYIYYFCARVFISRKLSLFTSIFIISCSIFSQSDLFAFISPYSYARAYGCAAFLLCTFLLIKLFKTDKLTYFYLASLVSGFCFICKFEFFIVYILLITAVLLYKKLSLFQYMKIFILSLIFPAIILGILLIQGVGIRELYDAAVFGYKFSKTGAMTYFLSNSGMYPTMLTESFEKATRALPSLITVIFLCFAGLKLNIKYSKIWIIPVFSIFIWRFFYDKYAIMEYWLLLPIFVLIILCFKYKDFLKNKPILLLIIASLLLAQRAFFMHSFYSYGILSFPLLFLSLCVIIQIYMPELFMQVKREQFIGYIIIILTGFYLMNLHNENISIATPLTTDKGTIYLDLYNYSAMYEVLTFIENNVDKNSSVLVLPEGQIINFLAGRKTDLKCHMMDRLYHDAYGEQKAKNLIESTNSDYIILINGFRFSNFNYPYLYEDNNLSKIYIDEHYDKVREHSDKTGVISIWKKKVNNPNDK